MARETNAMITFNDAIYMVNNEGFTALDTIPASEQLMIRSAIEYYLNADSSNFSTYGMEELVPYHLIEAEVAFSITPATYFIDSNAATIQNAFTITSNLPWSLSDNVSWLTISPTSGSGNATLAITVGENTDTTYGRIGSINISVGGMTKYVAVAQDAKEVDDEISIVLDVKEISGEWYVSWVTTNQYLVDRFYLEYQINGGAWVELTNMGGGFTGDYPIQSFIDARTGTNNWCFRVRPKDTSGDFGAYSNIDCMTFVSEDITPPTISTLTGYGDDDITIRLYWTSSDNVGVANHRIYYKKTTDSTYSLDSRVLGANEVDIDWNPPVGDTAGTSYNIYIRVYDANGNYTNSNTITASTIPVANTLTITPTSYISPSTGGTFTVTITSNTSWVISDSSSWITTSKTSGSGNSTFTVTISSNSGGIRGGSVTVKSADDTITRNISINQEATTATIILQSLGYNSSSPNCGAPRNLGRYHNGVNLFGLPQFDIATSLWSNSSGTIYAPEGYYTDGVCTRRWGGASFIGSPTYC